MALEIEDLNLTKAAGFFLRKCGIASLEQLQSYSLDDMFGMCESAQDRRLVEQIREALEGFGLGFRKDC